MALLAVEVNFVKKSADAVAYVGINGNPTPIPAGSPICRAGNGTFLIYEGGVETCVGITISSSSFNQQFLYVKEDAALSLSEDFGGKWGPCYAAPTGLTQTITDVPVGTPVNLVGMFNADGTLNMKIITGAARA